MNKKFQIKTIVIILGLLLITIITSLNINDENIKIVESSIDTIFSSELMQIIDLNITKQEGFEEYLDLKVVKIGNNKFRIDYNFNKEIKEEIKDYKKNGKKQKDKDDLKDKYFDNAETSLSNEELQTSLDNFDKTKIEKSSDKIKISNNEINLSKEKGHLYITLDGLNKDNINDYIGENISLGYNTITIETIRVEFTAPSINPSLAYDSTGVAHTIFINSFINSLSYCNNTDNTWLCSHIDTTSNFWGRPSLAIDSNDILHVSYYDSSALNLKYCNNTASSWSCVIVDDTCDVGEYSSIAIDTNNVAHIAYRDETNNSLKYCNNTANTWNCLEVNSGGDIGYYPSLSIDQNNLVHIVSSNITDASRNQYSMYYFNNSGGDWSYQFIGFGTNASKGQNSPSIVSNYNNITHISYSQNTSSWVVNCNNSVGLMDCSQVFIGEQNSITSIVTDFNSHPHIAYHSGRINLFSGLNTYYLRYYTYITNRFGADILIDEDVLTTSEDYYAGDRYLANKKGRLVDSNSYINGIGMVYYAPQIFKYAIYNPFVSTDLILPLNNSILTANVLFNCSSNSASNELSNVTFYVYNSSSDLINITTVNVSGKDITNTTSINITLTDDTYTWNCLSYTNSIYNAFNISNDTFTVDGTSPNISIKNLSTTLNSQTIIFNSTEQDLNLDSCKYSIFNSSGSIDGSNENVSYTCGEGEEHSATATGFGTFNLTIYAVDLADNENSSTQEFNISQTSSAGGGGGTTIILGESILAVNFSITTTNLKNQMDIALSKDSLKERKKEFLISNQGSEPITIEVICDTQDVNESSQGINICNYIEFENTEFTVSPNLEERSRGSFEILTPQDASYGDVYYFNLLAIRTIEGQTRYSKLSISSRVSRLAILYKWSKIPGTEKLYPVAPISLILSLLLFIGLFLIMRKKGYITSGFIMGLIASTLSFIIMIILL